MAQPDGAQSGTDPNAQSGGTGNGDGTGATGASGTPEAGATGTPAADATASGQTFSAQEYEALKARMVAADKRAAEKEAELKQLVDKDLPEMDKLRRDFEAEKTRADQATAELASMRVEIAFLKDNTHQWQNPATALKLLDRSKITVDPATGEISGMKQALEALTKSDAYLLKPKPAEGEGDGGTSGGTLGTPPANGGATSSNNPSKEAMQKRFSAMRSRG